MKVTTLMEELRIHTDSFLMALVNEENNITGDSTEVFGNYIKDLIVLWDAYTTTEYVPESFEDIVKRYEKLTGDRWEKGSNEEDEY